MTMNATETPDATATAVASSDGLARYMNTLLIGKAQVLPEIRDDIQRMVDNPGIWIVTDENQPGAEIPVVSMNGKLYAIELSTELAPERFLSTARVAGGPYRANAKVSDDA